MYTAQRSSRSTFGFTLVEIMVVLVLFGILIIIAAPNMGAFVRSTKLDGALNELTGDIAYTRMLAVRSGYPAILAFQSGGTSYNIRTIHRVGTDTVRRVAKQVNLADEYRGVSLSPASTVLTFNSRGLLVPTPEHPIEIIAQGASNSARATVLQTGRVSRDY